MKASKFTEAQIAFVLKQAEDGTPIGEVCRKAGISDATFYNWRNKYAGLTPLLDEAPTSALSEEKRACGSLDRSCTLLSPGCQRFATL